MAYTTIDDPSAHFHTQLYTGTGSELSITNNANPGDFKPDWIWIKQRNAVTDHGVFDSSRGVTKNLKTNTTDAESTEAQSVKTFNTDGFTLGTSGDYNGSSDTHVAWQWKANGGTTSSNGDGSTTSTVQANTTAGFSIVLLATGSAGSKTYGHGLGVAPEFIIIIDRTAGESRMVYHKGVANSDQHDKNLQLENTGAVDTTTDGWGTAVPTSTVFGVNSSQLLETDQDCIAYCFTSIQGYSKFGSYIGNGNADGPFVYTGFKVGWLLIKNADDGTKYWHLWDNKRNTFNPSGLALYPNANDYEDAGIDMDFLSNGFKPRASSAGNIGNINKDTDKYIYVAFAHQPFVT